MEPDEHARTQTPHEGRESSGEIETSVDVLPGLTTEELEAMFRKGFVIVEPGEVKVFVKGAEQGPIHIVNMSIERGTESSAGDDASAWEPPRVNPALIGIVEEGYRTPDPAWLRRASKLSPDLDFAPELRQD